MTPYYERDGVTLYNADCRAVLAGLPDQSVQCVVTSPPYFGLRDYGTATWGGGDAECDHKTPARADPTRSIVTSTLAGSKDTVGHVQEASYRDVCGKCGAVRVDSQIGLEQTPAAYVAAMVAVFREVRRVLREDGTLFLNLGDSYANNASTSVIPRHEQGNGGGRYEIPPEKHHEARRAKPNRLTAIKASGIKHKDLIGIPWRVAFALQEDGWWLRSDIIWNKLNPMPESVTDRPTRSHEYIFLLTKSARYYYDADAIAEPANNPFDLGLLRGRSFADGANVAWHAPSIEKRQAAGVDSRTAGSATRNKRDVWTVATAPYADAHFATFPPKLIEPCILAGCPAGGTVLDPFAGAGTTLLVAKKHNRKSVGIELNANYCDLIVNRLAQSVLPLAMPA